MSRPGWVDRVALALLNDERDLPFARLILTATLVQLPIAALLFVPGVFRWWMAIPYLAMTFLVFVDRYILMLHNTSHRALFKPRYRLLNSYVPWVLGPFFGETPETYFAHHLGMHHREGNMPGDLSSTMAYQRDNPLHFLHYFLRFFFLILVELSVYLARRKRGKLLRRMLTGELGYFFVVGVLVYLAPGPALTVFVIPLCMVRFLMMAGNWGQHAFIDPKDPENPLLNSITVVNCRYNQRCFNDGYHIGHHVKAGRHWTELPGDFLSSRAEYARAGAIVFEGIDFFMVWAFLMVRAYGTLARHMVSLDGVERTLEERVELLKARTRRFSPS